MKLDVTKSEPVTGVKLLVDSSTRAVGRLQITGYLEDFDDIRHNYCESDFEKLHSILNGVDARSFLITISTQKLFKRRHEIMIRSRLVDLAETQLQRAINDFGHGHRLDASSNPTIESARIEVLKQKHRFFDLITIYPRRHNPIGYEAYAKKLNHFDRAYYGIDFN